MCDFDCPNLIDLSLEDNSPQKTENVSYPPKVISQGFQFVSPPRKKRDSLENNPFDCVQKLANNRQDDPFDIVEKEACFKARHTKHIPVEVKLGNLLGLIDENSAENNCEDGAKKLLRINELDFESPPVTMSEKLLPDSSSGTETDSNANSSAEANSNSKLKKAMEYRKRLLKLSLSNSAFNSPVSRRSSCDESDGGVVGTPLTGALSRSPYYSEHLLSSESPLKFVDDDINDIMSEEPPSMLEAEKNFEADLEMMRLPILRELPTPIPENLSGITEGNESCSTSTNNTSLPKSGFDLDAIKARLRASREEATSGHQDINSLIYDLKSLINSKEMTDNGKQMQCSTLLESLSSAITSSHLGENSVDTKDSQLTVPLIKRQGTFDLDIKQNEKGGNEIGNQPYVHELPNCMTSSSATYDGEKDEEKDQQLNLPEIDPPSPETVSCETTLQPDVTDIMEQLSKLLIHNKSGDGNHNGQSNPTFIVLMNTTPMTQKTAMISSYMEDPFNEDSPDLNKSSSTMTRRRSQSLSLHDKVKFVQIPRQPPTPKRLQKQCSVAVDESPPVVTTPPPPEELETHEFKTPARMMRRNSYSSGTPYTATVGLRKTGFSSDIKTTSHLRMTQTLDTHHEGRQQQQKAIVRPMSMPTNNLPTFKPDLKKKHKPNTDSIMKASGPLKATIPIKKVAPMIKTSPPTPDKCAMNASHNSSQNKNRIPTTPASTRTSGLGVGVGYPNACSTPSSYTSPMKRASLVKPRYSHLSTTPNSKPISAPSNTAALKRRTIAEFKAKSPLKPRLSTSGSLATSTSARSATVSTRLSTSAGMRPPIKTPVKLSNNTATVRPTGRIGSRLSSVGSMPSNRNKENKHP